MSQQPVSGAAVQAGTLSSTTASDGRFTWSQPSAPAGPLRTSVTADGFLPRESALAWPRTDPDPRLDIISLAPPFSLTLYKQLVRDALESAELRPLYRWTTRPRVALHPFDDTGRPLPPEVLATIRAAVPQAVAAWSGGRFEGVALEGCYSDLRESGCRGPLQVRQPLAHDLVFSAPDDTGDPQR